MLYVETEEVCGTAALEKQGAEELCRVPDSAGRCAIEGTIPGSEGCGSEASCEVGEWESDAHESYERGDVAGRSQWSGVGEWESDANESYERGNVAGRSQWSGVGEWESDAHESYERGDVAGRSQWSGVGEWESDANESYERGDVAGRSQWSGVGEWESDAHESEERGDVAGRSHWSGARRATGGHVGEDAIAGGGGSSSLDMEIDGEDLGGRDQDLASEEAVHGCGMPKATQNFGKHEDDAEFVCTACGHSVAIVEVRAHPVLHVGVCNICYDFLFSSPFTKDNPRDPFEHENECRWCGDGGEVILCDTCPKAFCKSCIKRNFGEEILNTIESPAREWSCFVCNDEHLQTLINDYNNVENLVKTMNRSGQPRKSRTSRVSNSRIRSRRPTRRSRNETALASETIATIIARKKENLQRRYPHTNFTGFERPQQHRHPQHHFLLAQNNTKREHDKSESGDPSS